MIISKIFPALFPSLGDLCGIFFILIFFFNFIFILKLKKIF